MSNKNLIEGEDFQVVTPADNGLFTVRTLNTDSPSNSGLLEDFQNVDSIPVIPVSTNSCFDQTNLPKIQTLDSLLSNLCELMIRFDGCVRDYQKADFEHLVKTLSNSLIHLYTAPNTAISFIGVAGLTTNPIQDAIDKKNKYPGIYFADTIGTYTHFGVSVLYEDVNQSIVLLIPKIVNEVLVSYEKVIYRITNAGDKTKRHTQSISSKIWNIPHTLDKYPSVTVTNSSGRVVEGEVVYINKQNVVINFSAPFSGFADLN